MALRELTPRHHAIIRRMITGQPPREIAEELGISPSYLTFLKKDELFSDALEKVQNEVQIMFLATMGDAREIIDNLKSVSAKKLSEMIINGSIGGRSIKADKQADIVMKTLADFSGLKAPEEHRHLHVDMTNKIIEAYEKNKVIEEGNEELQSVENSNFNPNPDSNNGSNNGSNKNLDPIPQTPSEQVLIPEVL